MKKLLTVFTLLSLLLLPVLFAQESDDSEDFYISLDEDFSQVTPSEESTPASSSEKSNIAMGLWIESYSKNESLIRDIASGEIPGYEFDNSHLISYANWWFWGNITKNFQLDAEIALWDFDRTLYKANSWGSNPPDISFKDGLQSLTSMFFSPIYYCNDDGVGSFNKFAFNITTPIVKTRLGYGALKENGMSSFEGIFNVIDRWDDVGNGYLEIKNGTILEELGNFTIDILGALSTMRGTYGSYKYLDVKYKEIVESALTFTSSTTATNVFDYSTADDNAASAYLLVSPFRFLKLEAHALTAFGTNITYGMDSSAFAGRISFANDMETITASVMQSYSGASAATIWGDDDSIAPDTATTQIDVSADIGNILTLGLDQGITLNTVEDLSSGFWNFRTQPNLDFYLSDLINKDISLGLYGVIDVDRPELSKNKTNVYVPYIEEVGVEINCDGLFPLLQKLTVDYAMLAEYNTWTAKKGLKVNTIYHSVMVNTDLTENFNVHLGSIIRSNEEDTTVPFAIATGFFLKKTPLPGSPKIWAHFTYGMNPYEWYNYSMYRRDDPSLNPSHRTYLLNTLNENTNTSEVSVGFIWDIQ
ncbi:MAG: hypothetical protein K5866_09675 [Treponema sp.]|nr:hypothetical protein [Treponema sp.]